jgi:hypothetical protein
MYISSLSYSNRTQFQSWPSELAVLRSFPQLEDTEELSQSQNTWVLPRKSCIIAYITGARSEYTFDSPSGLQNSEVASGHYNGYGINNSGPPAV